MQYDKANLDEDFKTVNVGEFFDFVSAPANKKSKVKKDGVCLVCGYTAKKFLQTGFLGCSECYTNLFDVIKPVIIRLFGTASHCPREDVSLDLETKKDLIYETCDDVLELEKKLKQAVLQENFEYASVLKKKIDKLKKGYSNE